MEKPEFPPSTLARHHLENAWRARLEATMRVYRAATEEYHKLLRAEPAGRAATSTAQLDRARQAESEALVEYARVLRIFTDLTVHGKLPDETLPESARDSQPASPKTISVVDDDESIRDATKALLRSAGYRVMTFDSGELFLRSGAALETACIVLDVRMPGMDGLELQRRLNASQTGVPIIFLTAHDDARSRRLAMDGGAVDFLCKPFEANSLVTAVETAITRRAMAHGA